MSDRCWSCGREDVRKRPQRGKLFFPHKCPHGVQCCAGSIMGITGMNGPARGGIYYCPQCVEAYSTRKGTPT